MGFFSNLFGKTEEPKTFVQRDFSVEYKSSLYKRLISDYEITCRTFKNDYKNIVADYYEGADTILFHFEFCIKEFSRFIDKVSLSTDHNGIVSISFLCNLNRDSFMVSYSSEPWYKQGGTLHRVYTLRYGNVCLRYDITNSRWGDWYKYSDPEEEIFADMNGVSRR